MRTTKKELQNTVDRINRKLSYNKKGPIIIEYAYGRPAICDRNYSRTLSPRLPVKEMKMWLDGFESYLDKYDATLTNLT